MSHEVLEKYNLTEGIGARRESSMPSYYSLKDEMFPRSTKQGENVDWPEQQRFQGILIEGSWFKRQRQFKAALSRRYVPPYTATSEVELEAWADKFAAVVSDIGEIYPHAVCERMRELLPEDIQNELLAHQYVRDPEKLVDVIALTQWPSLDQVLDGVRSLYSYRPTDLIDIASKVSARASAVSRMTRRRGVDHQVCWPLLMHAIKEVVPSQHRAILDDNNFGTYIERLKVVQLRVARDVAAAAKLANGSESGMNSVRPDISSNDIESRDGNTCSESLEN